MPNDNINVAITTLKTSFIAGIGGTAHYLYQVSKGEEFKVWKFCVNIFLAGFVGYIMGEFLDDSFTLRDSFIAMSGFSAFPILSFIENKFPLIFEILLTKNTNIGDK